MIDVIDACPSPKHRLAQKIIVDGRKQHSFKIYTIETSFFRLKSSFRTHTRKKKKKKRGCWGGERGGLNPQLDKLTKTQSSLFMEQNGMFSSKKTQTLRNRWDCTGLQSCPLRCWQKGMFGTCDWPCTLLSTGCCSPSPAPTDIKADNQQASSESRLNKPEFTTNSSSSIDKFSAHHHLHPLIDKFSHNVFNNMSKMKKFPWKIKDDGVVYK